MNALLSQPLPEPAVIWFLVSMFLGIAYGILRLVFSAPFGKRRQGGWTEQQIADAMRIKQNLWKED